MLAVKVLQAQGIEVAGICFTSNFFNCQKAEAAAESLNVELKKVDIAKDVLALVKNPPSGYGKNLNPCIDCHSLMIRKAQEIAKTEKYDLIATGEVLGQRPFSQNKIALSKVAKLSGAEVLRPLSAKLLPETKIENSGLVIRGRLLDISGRNRERQVELAKKFHLKEFPMPAGGCLLTDPEFSARALKMLEYWPDCDTNDIDLLKNGRIFWFNLATGDKSQKILLIVGRKETENNNLTKLAKQGDFMVELIQENGPTSLIRTKFGGLLIPAISSVINAPEDLDSDFLDQVKPRNINEIIDIAKLINCYYAKKLRGKSVEVVIKTI